ncbi:MAG: hypothetical protein IPO21_17210 [Bacteroidales bacterium]|nr:hypothetical protein [Bacteroidales bacterium]
MLHLKQINTKTLAQITLFLLFFTSANIVKSQVFFFNDKISDSTSYNFYEFNSKFSLLANYNIQKKNIGISVFIHNEKQRLSYNFEAKTNVRGYYLNEGISLDSSSLLQKKSGFVEYVVATGIGISMKKNLLIYGNLGIHYINTLNQPNPDRDHYFKYENLIDIHLGVGVLYVLKNRISFSLGADVITKSINVGVGYSL